MAAKSPSTIVYEFAVAVEAAEPAGTILKGAEILDSKFQEIKTDKGIVVSNSEWDFGKKTEGTSIHDALIIIGFYYRIPGADTSERKEARDKCFELAEVLVNKIFNDFTLGGRVCDVRILRAVDGMDNTNSDSFAIINQPIILNPTGRLDINLGEAK